MTFRLQHFWSWKNSVWWVMMHNLSPFMRRIYRGKLSRRAIPYIGSLMYHLFLSTYHPSQVQTFLDAYWLSQSVCWQHLQKVAITMWRTLTKIYIFQNSKLTFDFWISVNFEAFCFHFEICSILRASSGHWGRLHCLSNPPPAAFLARL